MYLHVVVPGALYDESLHVVVGGEGGQFQQTGDLHSLVHLGNLHKKMLQKELKQVKC